MNKSLKRIAAVVTLGTFASKGIGFIRQLLIAAIFGIGSAYDAYNYAYILPGFFLVLLGGINGPFHNSMVSILSRRSKSEGSYILSSIGTIAGSFLLFISTTIFLLSDKIITIIGPGLSTEVHEIAVIQLQIMSPIIFLSGLIGLGFGILNANEKFLIPSISPIASSLIIIMGIVAFSLYKDNKLDHINVDILGGLILAGATCLGALFQLIIQLPELFKNKLIQIRFIWGFKNDGVQEVKKILIPAILSSGMLQINVFTDLFFASSIISAAAGLGYANFLVQAPLGLISNALLIPLLPTFSKLTHQKDRVELISRIRQGLIYSSASMITLGGLFMTFGSQIVALAYGRGEFNSDAINLVGGLLFAYGFGMPAYLGRDLLVRVFYALGDGETPFRFSMIGIGLNIFFDWFLVGGPSPWGDQLPFDFGVQGLVLATVAVNFLTCTFLLYELNIKLKGLFLKSLGIDCIKLLISGLTSGLISYFINSLINWQEGFISLLFEVSLSSLVMILLFSLLSSKLGVKEVEEIITIFKRKFIPL